jgi:hypothetical protein
MGTDVTTIETDHYSLALDAKRCLVEIRLTGHWDATIARSYVERLKAAMTDLGRYCQLDQHIEYVDLTGFGVQSKEVIAILETLLADATFAPRRAAQVIDTMLLTLQGRRVAPN